MSEDRYRWASKKLDGYVVSKVPELSSTAWHDYLHGMIVDTLLCGRRPALLETSTAAASASAVAPQSPALSTLFVRHKSFKMSLKSSEDGPADAAGHVTERKDQSDDGGSRIAVAGREAEGEKREEKYVKGTKGSLEKSSSTTLSVPAPTSTCSLIPYGYRTVPWKVMTEEDYVDTLTGIIERDFYPDLRRLRLLQQLRQAERTGDSAATEVLQLRLGAMTPATARVLHGRGPRGSDAMYGALGAGSAQRSGAVTPSSSNAGGATPASLSAASPRRGSEVGDLWSPLAVGNNKGGERDGDRASSPSRMWGHCDGASTPRSVASSQDPSTSRARQRMQGSAATPGAESRSSMGQTANQIVECAAIAAAQERSVSLAPMVKLVTGEIHQVPSERLTVDTFQSLYTTEDNASFDNIMMDDKIKKLQAVEWMYESELQHNKAVEDVEKSIVNGEKSLALTHNRCVAKTALMFEPDGLLPQLQPGLPAHLRKTLDNSATRFSREQRTRSDQLSAQLLKLRHMRETQDERHKAEFAAQAASFKDVADGGGDAAQEASSSAFWDPAQAEEEMAERRRQYVMSPNIMPGVGPDASPLMTWGKIASTPLLLNGSTSGSVDGLDRTPGLPSPGGDSGRTYSLPEQRSRDRAAETLMAQASYRVRSTQKRRRQGLEALTSSWVMSGASQTPLTGSSALISGSTPHGRSGSGTPADKKANTPQSPIVPQYCTSRSKGEKQTRRPLTANAKDAASVSAAASELRRLAARSTLFQSLLHRHDRSIAVDKQLRAAYSGRSKKRGRDGSATDLRSLQSTPMHRGADHHTASPSVTPVSSRLHARSPLLFPSRSSRHSAADDMGEAQRAVREKRRRQRHEQQRAAPAASEGGTSCEACRNVTDDLLDMT